MKNTVYGLKRLLGRKFRDPHVQREMQLFPFTLVEEKNGSIGIKVGYFTVGFVTFQFIYFKIWLLCIL